MGDNEKKPVLHTNDVGSLLDLKAEFLERKKAAVAKSYSEKYVNPTKGAKNILALSKEDKKVKEQASKDRQTRIQHNAEAMRKEEADQLKRRQILEQKTKVYNRMLAGEALTYDDGTQVEFLVNFERKKKELEERGIEIKPLEEDPADKDASAVFLGRRDEETPLIVHYDPSEEPGRMFGASHVPLPVHDEEERQKAIDELKQMTAETTKNRRKKKRALNAKATADRERLNRLRTDKGLPPLESSSESDGEEEGANGGPVIDVNTIPLPPGTPTASISSDAKTEKAEQEKPNQFKPVRDWDRGKFGYKRWIEGQRDVRNEEFAPPSSYYSDTKRKK